MGDSNGTQVELWGPSWARPRQHLWRILEDLGGTLEDPGGTSPSLGAFAPVLAEIFWAVLANSGATLGAHSGRTLGRIVPGKNLTAWADFLTRAERPFPRF